MTQLIKCLFNEHKALSSNLSIATGKRKHSRMMEACQNDTEVCLKGFSLEKLRTICHQNNY
jgi:hypothetical protein